MVANEYHMLSHWRVLGTSEKVFDIVLRAEELPRWWPSGFTEALPIQSGDETGEAKVVRLESRGFLPLLLRWHVVASEVDRPYRLVNKVWGDLEGECIWTFEQDGEWTEIASDWRIVVKMPMAAVVSPLVKPLLIANHRWAMAKGEQSLRLEVERQRATNDLERSRVSPPPPGIARATWGLAFGAGALLALLMVRRR
ncbi:MAG TPA: polyketide cyclase [Dehalococcoidia bacterium]|nr:polyketide cyclase [Dehalococcoidia bacterium]